MKLDKYVVQYAKSIGYVDHAIDFKAFTRSLKGYSVDNLSSNDLSILNNIISSGVSDNFLVSVSDYFRNKYDNTDVLQNLYAISKQDNFEFVDNLRISDGSVLDEVLYYVAKVNGCCGEFDTTLIVHDKTYKVGFNYGH